MNIYSACVGFSPFIRSIFQETHLISRYNAYHLKGTVIVAMDDITKPVVQHRMAHNLPTKVIVLTDEPLTKNIIEDLVQDANELKIPLKDCLVFCCWTDPNKNAAVAEVLRRNDCSEVSYIGKFSDWRAHDLDFLADMEHSSVAQRPNRMLCLTGSMDARAHRFHTIYHLHKNYLLKEHTVSALGLTKDVVEKWQEKYSSLDYCEDFVEVAVSKQYPVDDVLEHAGLVGGRPEWVRPVDPSVYDKNSFTYICESSDGVDENKFSYSAFFSEKTVWPIMYKHPFVLQASPGHLNYLKKLGFETFDSIINTDYNLYDNSKPDYKYVENTVLAAKDLFTKLNDPQTQAHVQHLVDRNFNNFIDLVKRYNEVSAKSLLKFSLGHQVCVGVDSFFKDR